MKACGFWRERGGERERRVDLVGKGSYLLKNGREEGEKTTEEDKSTSMIKELDREKRPRK